jgi:hypothetical protein
MAKKEVSADNTECILALTMHQPIPQSVGVQGEVMGQSLEETEPDYIRGEHQRAVVIESAGGRRSKGVQPMAKHQILTG